MKKQGANQHFVRKEPNLKNLFARTSVNLAQ